MIEVAQYLMRMVYIAVITMSVSWAAATELADNDPLLSISVPPDDLRNFKAFLAGRDPIDIDNYTGEFSSRVVVELVLQHQALRLGGYDGDIELIPTESYLRMLAMLGQGRVALRGMSAWREDVERTSSNFLITEALIEQGQFEAGLYTAKDNSKALMARNKADLAALTAVSSRQWQADWRALNSLGLQSVQSSINPDAMLKMLLADPARADITLLPFPSPLDLTVYVDGSELVPIPGLKVVLHGTRHWVASKKHPLGPQAFAALEQGIQELRAQGRIRRAYTEAGFFNPLVSDWVVINPLD